MPTGQTQICNMALALVGSRSTIAALTEQSKEAQALQVWYEPTLESLLRAAHWNFARKQLTLALIATTSSSSQNTNSNPIPPPPPTGPQPPPPWVNEYAYPSDCVLMRYLLPQFQAVPGELPGVPTLPDYIGPPVRFIIGSDVDPSGNPIKVLLTNQNASIGVYTQLQTNEEMFDADFVDAFAALLASRICVQLTGDKPLAKSRFDLAESIVRHAQSTNGNEGLRIQDVAPDWMRVRGYASDWAFPDGDAYYYGPNALTLIM